jgi:hypothetical protein
MNNRIMSQACRRTLNALSDKNLLHKYMKCKSVLDSCDKLQRILISQNLNQRQIDKIMDEYILDLIPPGTKAVIRGNKFNKIVKKHLLSFNLKNNYELAFEQKCENYYTDEIPDWYILNKMNGKVIIGMNQLDLWSGGQQLNRGYKYLFNEYPENVKFLCVVCNEVEIKSENSKTYKIFEQGFRNNTLCYLGGLEKIIHDFA